MLSTCLFGALILVLACGVHAQAPNITAAVDAASFAPEGPLAAGSIVSIVGTNLAAGSVNTATLPLPTTLLSTTVMVNGNPLPLFFVSPTQLNVLLPLWVSGPQASLVVEVGLARSNTLLVNIASVAPAIFRILGTQGAIVVGEPPVPAAPVGVFDGSHPASPGEVVMIYCTGLGPVSNAPAPGQPAPTSEPLAHTSATPRVMFGDLQGEVLFSGLAPGSIGLYQVNARVPSSVVPSNAVLVRIAVGDSVSNQATIAVAAPVIHLSRNNLMFAATIGGTQPSVQTVAINNSQLGTTLSWTAAATTSSGGNWLLVTPASGTNSGAVYVIVTPGALPAGTYSGNVQVIAPGVPSVDLPVILEVQAPKIALNPPLLMFDSPGSQTVAVSMSGVPLDWNVLSSVSFGGDWLNVSPLSGFGPGNLTVSVDPAGLAAGTYSGSVLVAAGGAIRSPQTLPVILTVPPRAQIGLTSTLTPFLATVGGANPLSQRAVTITNTGDSGTTLSWRASASSVGNWLSVSPTLGTNTTVLTVSADVRGLALGTYSGTILVFSASGTSTASLQVASVSLVISRAN